SGALCAGRARIVRGGTAGESVACGLSGAAGIQGDVGEARGGAGINRRRDDDKRKLLQRREAAVERISRNDRLGARQGAAGGGRDRLLNLRRGLRLRGW